MFDPWKYKEINFKSWSVPLACWEHIRHKFQFSVQAASIQNISVQSPFLLWSVDLFSVFAFCQHCLHRKYKRILTDMFGYFLWSEPYCIFRSGGESTSATAAFRSTSSLGLWPLNFIIMLVLLSSRSLKSTSYLHRLCLSIRPPVKIFNAAFHVSDCFCFSSCRKLVAVLFFCWLKLK